MTGAQAMLWQAGGLCAVFVLCIVALAFAPAHAGRHEWRRGLMTVEEGALTAGVHAITLTAPLIDLAIPPPLPCPTPRPYVGVDDPPTVPIVAARVELSTWWLALPAADNERAPLFRATGEYMVFRGGRR